MGCGKEKGCAQQLNLIMLRPVFTQDLADALLAGKHVNLVSPHGRGRRQTLLDLETFLLDVVVRKIDLKREQDTWKEWLEGTLSLNSQVIVIIHNIEYIKQYQQQALDDLMKFTLLCVSEQPFADKSMLNIEIPE